MKGETQEQGVPWPWVGGDEGNLTDGVYHDILDNGNIKVPLKTVRDVLWGDSAEYEVLNH